MLGERLRDDRRLRIDLVWSVACAVRGATSGQDSGQGAAALGRIRQRVALNLLLASITLAVATLGLAFQS